MLIIGDRQHYLQCLNGIANEADLSAGAKCIIAARNRLLINRKNYAKWTKSNRHSNISSQNVFSKTNEDESPTFLFISSDHRSEEELKTDPNAEHLTNRILKNIFESRIQRSLKDDDWIQQADRARKHPRQIQLPEVQSNSSPIRSESVHQLRWVSELQKRKKLAYERNHWQITTNIQLHDNTTKNNSTTHPTIMKTFIGESSYANFHQKFKGHTVDESANNSRIRSYKRRKRSPYRLITNMITRTDNEIIEVTIIFSACTYHFHQFPTYFQYFISFFARKKNHSFINPRKKNLFQTFHFK